MKIDRTSIPPIGSIQAASRVAKIKDKNNRGLGQDQIAVSNGAQVFQNLLQKAKELPDIREDKVKAVTDKIEQGKFNLDAASLAASLLRPLAVEGE